MMKQRQVLLAKPKPNATELKPKVLLFKKKKKRAQINYLHTL